MASLLGIFARLGGIVALILLVITLLSQLIALVGFLLVAVKVAIVVIFVAVVIIFLAILRDRSAVNEKRKFLGRCFPVPPRYRSAHPEDPPTLCKTVRICNDSQGVMRQVAAPAGWRSPLQGRFIHPLQIFKRVKSS